MEELLHTYITLIFVPIKKNQTNRQTDTTDCVIPWTCMWDNYYYLWYWRSHDIFNCTDTTISYLVMFCPPSWEQVESKSPPSGTPLGTKVAERDWLGGGNAWRPGWGQSSKQKILYQFTVGINTTVTNRKSCYKIISNSYWLESGMKFYLVHEHRVDVTNSCSATKYWTLGENLTVTGKINA